MYAVLYRSQLVFVCPRARCARRELPARDPQIRINQSDLVIVGVRDSVRARPLAFFFFSLFF